MYKVHYFAGELEGNIHYELLSQYQSKADALSAASKLELEGHKVIIIHLGEIVYESSFSEHEEITILEKRIPGWREQLRDTWQDIYRQVRILLGREKHS